MEQNHLARKSVQIPIVGAWEREWICRQFLWIIQKRERERERNSVCVYNHFHYSLLFHINFPFRLLLFCSVEAIDDDAVAAAVAIFFLTFLLFGVCNCRSYNNTSTYTFSAVSPSQIMLMLFICSTLLNIKHFGRCYCCHPHRHHQRCYIFLFSMSTSHILCCFWRWFLWQTSPLAPCPLVWISWFPFSILRSPNAIHLSNFGIAIFISFVVQPHSKKVLLLFRRKSVKNAQKSSISGYEIIRFVTLSLTSIITTLHSVSLPPFFS